MLRQAVLEDKGPVAVRYPRGGEGNYQTDKAQSLLKEGKDCTVITYGTTINAVLEAAEGCEKEGISVEVLKFATIAPLDFAAVEASCRKTGWCWWWKRRPITAALPTSFSRACCKAVSWDTSASRISETATSATARCRIYMRWRG